MSKEIKKLTDPKKKAEYMDLLADKYLEFIDNALLYSQKMRLFYLYDNLGNEWLKRTMKEQQSGIHIYGELYKFARLNGINENKYISQSRIQQEIYKLKTISEIEGRIAPEFSKDRYHNFKDGLFDVREGKMLPHDTKVEHWTDYKYDFDLDFDKDNFNEELSFDDFTGNLKKFFVGALENDEELLLMFAQMLGTAISDVRYPVMYFLYGRSGTAKSTSMDILKALVGQDRVGVSKLEEFAVKGASNFAVATAVLGNKINIAEEISSGQLKGDTLKGLISDEDANTEMKGIQKEKTKINTRFYGTTNNLLDFGSISGMDRRAKFIVLQRLIPSDEVDIELVKKIKENKEEMRQLFLFAYKGLLTIRKNKNIMDDEAYLNGFFQNKESRDYFTEVKEQLTPVFTFLKLIEFTYDEEEEGWIGLKEFHEVYKEWADKEEYDLSKTMLYKTFKKWVYEYMEDSLKVPYRVSKTLEKRMGSSRLRKVGLKNVKVNDEIIAGFSFNTLNND